MHCYIVGETVSILIIYKMVTIIFTSNNNDSKMLFTHECISNNHIS